MDAPTEITAVGRAPTDTSPTEPRLADNSRVRRTDLALTPRPPDTAAEPDDTAADGAPSDDAAWGSRLIRPYAMTGGRTASSTEISLESQIQTSTRLNGDSTKYRWEAAKILQLAERPMALVELAARAEIPLGVARVVISDLVDAGALNIQRNAPVTSYTSLLEKVLDGIRDL